MGGSLACSRIKLGSNTQIFFILTSSPSLIRNTTEEIMTFNLWDYMNSFVISNCSIRKYNGFMDLCVVGSWMSITNSRGWIKIYVLRIYWVMISRESWKWGKTGRQGFLMQRGKHDFSVLSSAFTFGTLSTIIQAPTFCVHYKCTLILLVC